MTTRSYDPVLIARQFLFVREIPENRGRRVSGIQHWSGGQEGASWCAEFATMVLDIAYQGNAPIPRTGSCDEILNLAEQKSWIIDDAREALPGDLYLRVRNGNDAHHVGILTQVPKGDGQISQIAGNTSADGTSTNGDGVHERTIMHTADMVFVRVVNS